MNFPPYGLMPDEWVANKEIEQPERFRNADGSAPSKEQWSAWLDEMAEELALFLWPQFIGGEWHGTATAKMELLTRADLAAMGPLFDKLDQPVAGTTVKHGSLFIAEDPKPPNVAGFLHYAPGAPDKLVKHFDALLLEGGGAVARPVSLNLKRRMQRPRPYQMALMIGPTSPLRYRAASSATSPALVSGHCIQGTMALANVVVKHEALYGKLDDAVLGLMQQYFIDTGDRRVFAAVHYPTDNLSSWYVALRLCCRVFDTPSQAARAREVLWQAIAQKSAVYLAMKRALADDAKSPFAEPLRRLAAEAASPCSPSNPTPANAARATARKPKTAPKRKRSMAST